MIMSEYSVIVALGSVLDANLTIYLLAAWFYSQLHKAKIILYDIEVVQMFGLRWNFKLDFII